jgi:hypothetical protein
MLIFRDVPILWLTEQEEQLQDLGITTQTDFNSVKIFRFACVAYAYEATLEGRTVTVLNINGDDCYTTLSYDELMTDHFLKI